MPRSLVVALVPDERVIGDRRGTRPPGVGHTLCGGANDHAARDHARPGHGAIGGQDSDADVLVSFERDAEWSVLDLVAMQEELAQMLGWPVDLVKQAALGNPYRRSAILRSKQVVYAA